MLVGQLRGIEVQKNWGTPLQYSQLVVLVSRTWEVRSLGTVAGSHESCREIDLYVDFPIYS